MPKEPAPRESEPTAAAQDVHRKTASEIFGVPEAEVTPEQRRAARAINFLPLYGTRGK